MRSTVGDTVPQMMGKMFHNNLLEHFSYIGQKKKRPFQGLNSNQIIFGKFILPNLLILLLLSFFNIL